MYNICKCKIKMSHYILIIYRLKIAKYHISLSSSLNFVVIFHFFFCHSQLMNSEFENLENQYLLIKHLRLRDQRW